MSEPTYTITVSWNGDILQLDLSGRASVKNADAIAQEVINIANKYKPQKVLIDCQNLTGRLGVLDTYDHVRNYPKQRPIIIKIAVLDLPENKQYYEFHETTAANSGAPQTYFTDYAKAIEWLNM